MNETTALVHIRRAALARIFINTAIADNALKLPASERAQPQKRNKLLPQHPPNRIKNVLLQSRLSKLICMHSNHPYALVRTLLDNARYYPANRWGCRAAGGLF